jgi:hypothetical protein
MQALEFLGCAKFKAECDAMLAADTLRNGHLIQRPGDIAKAPETCREALELWDSGEYVVTAEMGGLGAGYEVCIQSLAFELIREFADDPLPDDGLTRRDAIVARLNGRFGFSNGQVVAATNLALCVVRQGYRVALAALPAERLIRARKPAESHKLS